MYKERGAIGGNMVGLVNPLLICFLSFMSFHKHALLAANIVFTICFIVTVKLQVELFDFCYYAHLGFFYFGSF